MLIVITSLDVDLPMLDDAVSDQKLVDSRNQMLIEHLSTQ
jgi:hypothetical protein